MLLLVGAGGLIAGLAAAAIATIAFVLGARAQRATPIVIRDGKQSHFANLPFPNEPIAGFYGKPGRRGVAPKGFGHPNGPPKPPPEAAHAVQTGEAEDEEAYAERIPPIRPSGMNFDH